LQQKLKIAYKSKQQYKKWTDKKFTRKNTITESIAILAIIFYRLVETLELALKITKWTKIPINKEAKRLAQSNLNLYRLTKPMHWIVINKHSLKRSFPTELDSRIYIKVKTG